MRVISFGEAAFCLATICGPGWKVSRGSGAIVEIVVASCFLKMMKYEAGTSLKGSENVAFCK